MGSEESHFNVSIGSDGQSHKTVSTNHNFWRERGAEAVSNRGPSAYQPTALPLGQTGSHVSGSMFEFLRALRSLCYVGFTLYYYSIIIIIIIRIIVMMTWTVLIVVIVMMTMKVAKPKEKSQAG